MPRLDDRNTTTAATAWRRRSARTPARVYTLLVLGLIILLAFVALTTVQTPPPAIAEFAPAPQKEITQAPNNQAGKIGSGSVPGANGTPGVGGQGGAGTGGNGPEVTVPTKQVEKARVLRCVGNPPRQTEDPQSPPCVAYWDGDNGGSTWKGVTRDQITIAYCCDSGDTQAWVNFFNSRFEFYGRKIVLAKFNNNGSSSNTSAMISDADTVDSQLHAFASEHYSGVNGLDYIYYDELAKRQIVSANTRPDTFDEQHLRDHDPYEWNVVPGWDVILSNQARFICSSLAHKNADFAGGTEKGRPRVFGLINVYRDERRADLSTFKAILNACGVQLAAEGDVNNGSDSEQAQVQNAVLQMQSNHVTSVIFVGWSEDFVIALPSATKQSFFPEWLVSTYLHNDDPTVPELYNYPQQFEHIIATGWWNKQNPPEDSPWDWALHEQNPNFHYYAPPADYYSGYEWTYPALLLLASGIQMAGPNLTPETFARGLQAAQFPNPGAGGPPYYQAHVGFENDHTMFDDASLMWGNQTAGNTWGTGPASWCWAKQGARYAIGRNDWPTDYGGLFQTPCY